MPLQVVKARDVTVKLVDDRKHSSVLDDEEVNNMIKDFMSNDFIDKEGNRHQCANTGCGNTVIRVLENHFEKFTEAMKNVPPQKLQEIKEQIHDTIQKDPSLGISLDDIGIDLDNFENYLGSVEVLTVERVRVYNVYEIKKNNENMEEK